MGFGEYARSGKTLTRRRFMGSAATSTALGALAGFFPGCTGGMRYAILGRTGIRASVVNCDQLPERMFYEIAVAAGVNYWHKMGRWGEPEFFTRLDRDSFACDLSIDATEEDAAIEEFERGLARSGLSMIDGFKVHSVYRFPEEVKTVTGPVRAFERLKKQGKTRFLMLSQHRNVVEVLDAAIESDQFDAIQVPVHPLIPHDYFSEKESYRTHSSGEYFGMIRKAAERNIGITAMKTVVGGPKNWETIPGFREKVGKYLTPEVSLPTALIRWALEVPGVQTFATSMKSVEMFRENLAAAGARLSESGKEAVREFARVADSSVCRMCGACERADPGGTAVSDVLRYSLYYTAYGEPERARMLYRALPRRMRVKETDDLSVYERSCPYGLPVAHMLRKAKEMLA